MTAHRAHILYRLSALGDLVLCTALVERIAQTWPRDEIVFVTRAEFGDFVRAHFPAKIRVEGLRRPRFGLAGWFGRGWFGAPRLASGAREAIIYDLHGVSKSSALIWGFRLRNLFAMKVPVRILRSSKRTFARLCSIVFGRDFIGARHVFREHLRLAEQVEGSSRPSTNTPRLSFAPAPDSNERAKRILIAPDASRWKKKWLVSHWERLLERILSDSHGYTVTLVGSPTCLPQDFRDDLSAAHGARVQDLLGKTALDELPSIAATHAVTICGNSAWLHISEAVGTPVVALAGPIVPGFGFSPWRAESSEISVDLECRPCTRHGGGVCRRVGADFHACMRLIHPEEVWTATKKILALQQKAPL